MSNKFKITSISKEGGKTLFKWTAPTMENEVEDGGSISFQAEWTAIKGRIPIEDMLEYFTMEQLLAEELVTPMEVANYTLKKRDSAIHQG